jgi:hypothetical protein
VISMFAVATSYVFMGKMLKKMNRATVCVFRTKLTPLSEAN